MDNTSWTAWLLVSSGPLMSEPPTELMIASSHPYIYICMVHTYTPNPVTPTTTQQGREEKGQQGGKNGFRGWGEL